jgi:hypothetical protein
MKSYYNAKEEMMPTDYENIDSQITMERTVTIEYNHLKTILNNIGTNTKNQYHANRFRDWKNNLGPASLICEFFPE